MLFNLDSGITCALYCRLHNLVIAVNNVFNHLAYIKPGLFCYANWHESVIAWALLLG